MKRIISIIAAACLFLVFLAGAAAQANEYLCWTDSSSGKIKRSGLDGTSAETILKPQSPDPFQTALDLTSGKVYWTDLSLGGIQRSDIDGKNIETVITGISGPAGIALDLSAGKVYWTDYTTGTIQCANLDGSGAEDIVVSGLSAPQGIALTVPTPTSVKHKPTVATALFQNFPNLFNPSTLITFTVEAPTAVTLTVYGVDGKRIASLVDGTANPGRNECKWNGTDDCGNRVASGVYFYQLRTNSVALTRKMVLLK